MSSNDGRTIFLNSAGGTGHFYRLDTWSDTLTEDPSYGPIGIDLHALVVTANEKTAYITARGVADEIKVLNLNGTDVSTIFIDPRAAIADRPDGLARKGSNLYVTVRYSGQVARIKLRQAAWSTSMSRHPPQAAMRFTGSPFDLDGPESFVSSSAIEIASFECGVWAHKAIEVPPFFHSNDSGAGQEDLSGKTLRPSSMGIRDDLRIWHLSTRAPNAPAGTRQPQRTQRRSHAGRPCLGDRECRVGHVNAAGLAFGPARVGTNPRHSPNSPSADLPSLTRRRLYSCQVVPRRSFTARRTLLTPVSPGYRP